MENKPAENFGKNLRALMEERGITFRELEKHIGTSDSSLQRYAHGTIDPPVHKAKAIAQFFGKTLDEMVEDNHAGQ